MKRSERRAGSARCAVVCGLLLTVSCHAPSEDSANVESASTTAAAEHPGISATDSDPMMVVARVQWTTTVVDTGAGKRLRVTARHETPGQRLLLHRMDPQGINPRILLLCASVDVAASRAFPQQFPIEESWEFSCGNLDSVQIVGNGGVLSTLPLGQ